MPYDLQGNKIATRERLCNLTKADLDAFSALLREAFPGIRFWRSGLDNNGRIQEVASLADCGSSSSAVLPEPSWKPKFGRHPQLGFPQLKNTPKKAITFCKPGIKDDFHLREPCASLENGSPSVLDIKFRFFNTTGAFFAAYRLDDPETKAFVQAVFRLTRKLMTNAYELVDLRNGEVVQVVKGHYIWAGQDAARTEEPKSELQSL